MAGLITLLATLVISLLVTRIGAVALMLTGMSQEAARFQARSAFTGVGYTTAEAEQVVNHPVRRKIASLLMMCGNVGIAVVIASMMATFAVPQSDLAAKTDSLVDPGSNLWRILLLIIGLGSLWIVGNQRWVDQRIQKTIEWALIKWTHLDVRDYVSLLHLADGYVVMELVVNEGDWVGDKCLSESRLSSEGVLVLGLHRAGGTYVGSPNGKTVVKVGDSLTVYGPIDRLEELDLRKEGFDGDRAHRIAIATQIEATKEQEIVEPE